jgi:hypothetical protein
VASHTRGPRRRASRRIKGIYFDSEELDFEPEEDAGFDSVDELDAGVELEPDSELPDGFPGVESLFCDEPLSVDFALPPFP